MSKLEVPAKRHDAKSRGLPHRGANRGSWKEAGIQLGPNQGMQASQEPYVPTASPNRLIGLLLASRKSSSLPTAVYPAAVETWGTDGGCGRKTTYN